jgi:hypothetical protein
VSTAETPSKTTITALRAELDRLRAVEQRWLAIRESTARELAELDPAATDTAFSLEAELATVERMLFRTRQAIDEVLQTCRRLEAARSAEAPARRPAAPVSRLDRWSPVPAPLPWGWLDQRQAAG